MLSKGLRFLLVLAISAPLGSQPKLYPIDDTHKDRSFAAYVRQLKRAVVARDPKALRKLAAADIVVQEKPSRKGWAEFEAYWEPANAKSAVWTALEDMLDLGFVQEHPQTFLSPYVVWRFPDPFDPTTHWAVAWGDEALREQADPRSKEIRRLAFEIVKRLREEGRWAQVETHDGQKGWLSLAAVKSPLMPRAQFNLEKGKWLMVSMER
jgi:hypothetical protein